MGRPTGSKKTPGYREHAPTNRAVVTIDGRDIYLGKYGTKESRREYDRLIGEWLANGRRLPAAGRVDLSVSEVIEAFWTHAKVYYRKPDGTPTSEQSGFRLALSPLRRLYGKRRAVDFGPLALKAIAGEMIRLKWCRKSINRHLSRIRHVWKWAAGSELINPTCYHALLAVSGLQAGRTEAKESAPVRPVPEEYVTAIVPHLSAQVRAMVDLQLLTGMRPGEVCQMRTGDIDTTGKLWQYVPADHKTSHLGHHRTIYLGPRAQTVLGAWLRPILSECLFRPDEAEATRRQKMTDARTTPEGQGNAPGTNRTRKPKVEPGERYTVASYRRAIARACDAAFPLPEHLARLRFLVGKKRVRLEPKKQWRARLGDKLWAEAIQWLSEHRWHPHQLRHNAATRLRKEYGLEAAQCILGHKTLSVTEIYAEKNVAAAQRIMAEVG